jgi:periplasmic protein TonB
MFEDSLLESGGRNSKLRRRGPWATVFSFALQSALVGVLVMLPLIFTDTLPKQQLMTYLVAPPPPPPPPPPPAPAAPVVKAAPKPVSQITDTGQLKAPTKIPEKVAVVKEEEPPPSLPSTVEGVVGGVPGGIPGGTVGGVPGGVLGGIPDVKPAPPPPPPPPAKPLKVSAGVTAGLRERMVPPVYPPLAKAARISGTVILQAVIGKDGSIQQLKALSGHPMLIPSAIDAVSQWKYKPYYLNGQPVEVDTQVTVNFVLQGG